MAADIMTAPPPLPKKRVSVTMSQIYDAVRSKLFKNRAWLVVWLMLTTSIACGIIAGGSVLAVGAKLYFDYKLSGMNSKR
jgi:hypothetical protein